MGRKNGAPETRTSSTSLAAALFTRTQQRVLALLFGHPERRFYATELIGLVGAGSGAVQRELARLQQSGLVVVHKVGNQKFYQANPSCPIYDELRGIVRKTVGLAEPLREALAPLAAQIRLAFVYGSVAKGEDTSASDIDIMVVSDRLTYADIYAALEEIGTRLGRKVNPTLYSQGELVKRLRRNNAFLKRVYSKPKIWLIGNEGDLAAR
jgi:predicted nucleotidyltransferase